MKWTQGRGRTRGSRRPPRGTLGGRHVAVEPYEVSVAKNFWWKRVGELRSRGEQGREGQNTTETLPLIYTPKRLKNKRRQKRVILTKLPGKVTMRRIFDVKGSFHND